MYRIRRLCTEANTCYIPYTVEVDIEDQLLELTPYGTHGSLPKMVHFLNKDNSGRDGSRNERSREYLSNVDGYHGIFFHQPTCLKRAFHFEKMELNIIVCSCFACHFQFN